MGFCGCTINFLDVRFAVLWFRAGHAGAGAGMQGLGVRLQDVGLRVKEVSRCRVGFKGRLAFAAVGSLVG